MSNKLIALLIVLLTISCKSQVFEKHNLKDPQDFSNQSYQEGYDAYLNNKDSEKQLEKVKVVYKNTIYGFKKFSTEIGFKDAMKVNIIKDSAAIAKYKLKNCDVLMIVETND